MTGSPSGDAVDLAAALAGVAQAWSPLTVATMNDYDVRVVRAHGEFTRHSHPETDELFLVVRGRLTIRLDDGDVTLGPGQLCVVPRGVPHQPVSPDGAELLLLEPSATVNTGDSPGALTAPRRLAEDPAVGGEPVCLLDRVCPDCGRVTGTDEHTTCPGCGRGLPSG